MAKAQLSPGPLTSPQKTWMTRRTNPGQSPEIDIVLEMIEPKR